MLPEGIGVSNHHLNVREASKEEFSSAIDAYERNVAQFADEEVDLIHPMGAPPFMLLGYAGEKTLIDKWQKKFGRPIFTSGQNHVRAMQALGIRKFIGASYSAVQNKIVVDYMTEAGFDVVSMEPIDVPFEQASHISPEMLYAHIKKLFRNNPAADGIYIQGSAWRVERVVELLEQDLQIPVVHANIARAWEIQKRLRIHQPLKGFGRLYEQLPPIP
jgi:maleate cis-trans isomerase